MTSSIGVHSCVHNVRNFLSLPSFSLQLGHGDTLKKTRPVQIAALADKSIVSVVCGQYHSLALDDDHQ